MKIHVPALVFLTLQNARARLRKYDGEERQTTAPTRHAAEYIPPSLF
jgi:hypothetical protein